MKYAMPFIDAQAWNKSEGSALEPYFLKGSVLVKMDCSSALREELEQDFLGLVRVVGCNSPEASREILSVSSSAKQGADAMRRVAYFCGESVDDSAQMIDTQVLVEDSSDSADYMAAERMLVHHFLGAIHNATPTGYSLFDSSDHASFGQEVLLRFAWGQGPTLQAATEQALATRKQHDNTAHRAGPFAAIFFGNRLAKFRDDAECGKMIRAWFDQESFPSALTVIEGEENFVTLLWAEKS